MVSIGVIYDFIRPEEKILVDKARNQGVEAKLIDAKSVYFNISSSLKHSIASLNNSESLHAILESREYPHPIYHLYYIQGRVRRPSRDIRSLVVDDQFIYAIYWYQPPLEWRTNLARGGRAEPCLRTRAYRG